MTGGKKMNKKFMNFFDWIITPIILITLSAYFEIKSIPAVIFVRDGTKVSSNYFIKLSEIKKDCAVKTNNKLYEKKLNVKLLGVFPVKSVIVKSVPGEIYVYPGGQPIGVKLNTKGVLIVAFSDVQGMDGKISSPGAENGIEIGDTVLEINGDTINGIDDTIREINKCEGKEIKIKINRKGNIIYKDIKPVKCLKDNKYKIGLWIRESTAGVGTLTFYDDKSHVFAGLGHPITDADTGTILTINSGEIVSSSIISVVRGIKGSPGELKGIFVDEDIRLGNISKNTECGIYGNSYGKLCNKVYSAPIPIGLRSDIKEGPAKILTTIEGSTPKEYNIVIEKLLVQDTPGPKSMVIRITDPELLKKTGGIVQGMSGSPIIQNGKLVGAVTHVLVNKPDTGYGIYIEWMLKDADILKNY